MNFTYKGINYSIINEEKGTARVGLCGETKPYVNTAVSTEYSLPFKVPQFVFDSNGRKNEVVEIGFHACFNCMEMTAIILPCSIEIIKYGA